MRWSQWYIPTLKEAPGDAEVISHKLLIRAGMIRKLTSGIYTWLPLGLRTLTKASNIVREEMNRAGAQEILMPCVQPADLWRESGRWDHYGKNLLRFKDRHDRDYCFGPTHEEVITDLIRGEVRSYRQLPMNLYQIQTKFRDEIRPRFGLMRGREFMMKDAYSFDRDDAGADKSYWNMFEAYKRIFSRMALQFRPVEADSGAIGGNFSHEFMVLAETGEDTIAYCTACDWAANVERAAVLPPATAQKSACAPAASVATPEQHTIEEVCAFLKAPASQLIKTLIYVVDGQPVAALVRGDRELNEIKLKNLLHANDDPVLASPEQVTLWTHAPVGFAGPIGFTAGKIVVDHELMGATDYIVGANAADAHLVHVDLERDVPDFVYSDLRAITATDTCPHCGKPIGLAKGIEAGHVFKLGTKYSTALNAIYLDENSTEQPIIMGCYGIGVSRVVAACIEQNNDADGIVFPPPLAPFDLQLLNLDPKNADVSAKAEELYALLTAEGLEILLDDREERPGVKFKDADLMGLPMQLVLGGKGLGRGIIEAKNRKTGEKVELPLNDFLSSFKTWRTNVLSCWGV
ncbi:MAG: proline--tRNA ligase [Bilophila sp.]